LYFRAEAARCAEKSREENKANTKKRKRKEKRIRKAAIRVLFFANLVPGFLS